MLYISIKKSSFWLSAALGVLTAFAALNRPTMLLLPFVFAAVLFLCVEPRRAAAGALAIVVPFCLLVGAWTYRNYVITGEFIPVTIGADIELWNGSYQPAKGDMEHPLAYKRRAELFSSFDQNRPYYEFFSPFRQKAFKNIKEDPLGYVGLLPRKFFKLFVGSYSFNLNIGVPLSDILKPGGRNTATIMVLLVKLIMIACSFALLFFTLFSLWLNRANKYIFIPFAAVFAYMTVIHLIFSPIQRFSLPLLPLMSIFCFDGIIKFYSKLKGDLISYE
jgi:hypothetical protein